MADASIITIGEQKFRKVKGVWVDQKKTPAPKDLIALLEKINAEENKDSDKKESKPPLPVLPIATKDFSNAKLEASINKLAKVIDKLTKFLDKSARGASGGSGAEASPAQRIYEPGNIPTLKEAAALNRKEFLHGTKNKYGEIEQIGLLRNLASINPLNWKKMAAEDRRSAAIGGELRKYEASMQGAGLSKKEIDQKIQEKRQELETSKVAIKVREDTSGVLPKGEQELSGTYIKEPSKYASPDLDTNVMSVKITDIDDSVIKKLKEVFGLKPEKEQPAKAEDKDKEDDGSGGGSILDMFNRNKRRRGHGKASKINKPEMVKDASGKMRYAKGAVDPVTGEKIGGRFVKEAEEVTEQAPKKSIMSRIFGGGAKAAEKEGVKVAEKAGLKTGAKILGKGLLKSGLKKIPGLGLLAGGAFAAGRALSGDWSGAGLELASGAASTLPGIGTAASLGIDAALAAKDMGAFGGSSAAEPEAQTTPAVPTKPKSPSKFASVAKALGKGALMAAGPVGLGALAVGSMMGHKKQDAEMARSAGVTPQTQALTLTTKRVEAAKEQKTAAAPTIINNSTSSPTTISNSQGVIGGPTVADRGSLNLASF